MATASESCCQQQQAYYCDAIIEAILPDLAPGGVNLLKLNAMICFDLNTVARH